MKYRLIMLFVVTIVLLSGCGGDRGNSLEASAPDIATPADEIGRLRERLESGELEVAETAPGGFAAEEGSAALPLPLEHLDRLEAEAAENPEETRSLLRAFRSRLSPVPGLVELRIRCTARELRQEMEGGRLEVPWPPPGASPGTPGDPLEVLEAIETVVMGPDAVALIDPLPPGDVDDLERSLTEEPGVRWVRQVPGGSGTELEIWFEEVASPEEVAIDLEGSAAVRRVTVFEEADIEALDASLSYFVDNVRPTEDGG